MTLHAADEPPRSRARFAAFGVTCALLTGALLLRLAQLQLVSAGTLGAGVAAMETPTIDVPIRAARGLIFDRNGLPLAVNQASWTVSVVPADVPAADRARTFGLLADIVGRDAATMRARVDGYPGSPLDPVPVARNVSREAALLLAERASQLPGVVIETDAVRRYLGVDGQPDGELLSHVVGYTGAVTAAELEESPDAGYLRDDVVGRTGVESTFEELLRGRHGSRRAERGADGRIGQAVSTVRDPVAGTSLVLTIDARMQQHATDALRWGMSVAGVGQGVTIVMNPQTGEILAMVSLPTHDANAFAAGISDDTFDAYLADPHQPLRNHAIADIYAPGSTFKLVTAIAALEERVTTPDQAWQTYACFQIPGAAPGECLHDWNREGFGAIDIVDAFAHSSDTFFYQMAIELGIDRLAHWADELGFGRPTGVALPGEADGIVPSSAWARQAGRPPIYTGELAQAGIGQSMVAATPLQVLNAYAAVANGGRLMEPTIVRGEADAQGNLAVAYEPRVARTLDVDPSTLETMRIASREVVASGHVYNIRDLRLPGALSGKTGTAEYGAPTPDGPLPFHSWFVAFLPTVPGATDAELAVITFSYGAVVPGNVSAEVVKHFLQLHFGLEEDLRLDPRDFTRVAN